MLLNRCYYCHYNKHQANPTEGVTFLAFMVFCFFELVDSFQWFFLFDNFVGCKVLGAIREYAMFSSLVVLMCIGTHLLMLMTHPKCLRVIKEEKKKRHNILQRFYYTATFLLPVFSVPWPFITIKYGKDEYLCWIADTPHCNASSASDIIDRLVMWHIWAVLVWLFAVAVVILAFYKYCIHQSRTMDKVKPGVDSIAIITILIVFIIGATANAILFAGEEILGRTSFIVSLQAAIITPLVVLIYFLLFFIQQLRIIRAGPKEIVRRLNVSEVTHRSYDATSPTYFSLPEEK